MSTTIALPCGLHFTVSAGPRGTGLIGELTVPDEVRHRMGDPNDFCIKRFAPGPGVSTTAICSEAAAWLRDLADHLENGA